MLRRSKSKSKYPSPAQERERREWADCHGIPFSEYRLWLPEKVSDWRQVVRVQDDSIERQMHEWFNLCWNYDKRTFFDDDGRTLECHHVIGGTKGRSDEYANIAMLCRGCHANANTDNLPLGRILFLKWREDRAHVDWVRLALLHRQHLPDLITD